jgi:hypothetical protein
LRLEYGIHGEPTDNQSGGVISIIDRVEIVIVQEFLEGFVSKNEIYFVANDNAEIAQEEIMMLKVAQESL